MASPPPDSLLSPTTHAPGARLHAWLAALWPAPVRIDARERLRAVLGAAIGILLTALLCRWIVGASGASVWLVGVSSFSVQ